MDEQKPTAHVSPDHRSPATVAEETPKKKKHWVWFVVLVLILLVFYWGLRRHGQPAKSTATAREGASHGRFTGPVTLTTATVTKGSIGVYIDAIGTVTAEYTDAITAQVTGVITAVHYHEGQMVHKGDPLIDIDPRQYQAQVLEAQGALDRDRGLLAEAQMDLTRYQQAWARNAIPRQTLEDQEKLVLQDQGTVQNDLGTLQYDQVQLSYCHIVSRINGRVGLRLVDPGNLVTANGTTTLVVVTAVQPITVVATISEDFLSEVMAQPHHGIGLPLEAWDRQNQTRIATGKVTSFDNQIDTTTGTIKLRATYDNRNGLLYPNEFVNTRLLVKTLQNQTLLPGSAIQHNGATAFVYLIQHTPKGLRAKMQVVKTGISDNDVTAVQGLNPGDVVADSSFEKLQDGSEVRIAKNPLPALSNSYESSAP
jgi:membrane fusion protein, multidrug efflux system